VDVTRLFSMEWRRLRMRRLVRVFIVIALLNIVISGVWVFAKSNRDLAGAESARLAQVERCNQEFGPPGPGGFGPGPGFCDDFSEVKDPRFHLADLPRIYEALAFVFVFAMWALAASFIGAEWEAGTVGTLLTHEPRRGRVLVAKAGVAVAFAMVATAIILALLSLALLPAAIVRGTTEGTGGAWIGDTAGLGLRVIAGSGLAAVFGFSLATAARRTSVAIGVLLLAFLYETIVRSIAPGWVRWQLTENLATFGTVSSGSSSTSTRSIGGAGILLSIYAAGVFTATALGFRRRDVA
jgi:hypothetical protein